MTPQSGNVGTGLPSAAEPALQAASDGGRSSVGRAPDCDSGRRGFESHRPPHPLECRFSCAVAPEAIFAVANSGFPGVQLRLSCPT